MDENERKRDVMVAMLRAILETRGDAQQVAHRINRFLAVHVGEAAPTVDASAVSDAFASLKAMKVRGL